MPHVVLNGTVSVENVFLSIKPILIRDEKTVLKTSSVYIERNKKSLLADSLVIEDGKKINFFALINDREDGIVVRIYPLCEFEKTSGVKKLLAEIAKQIQHLFPNLKVGETNLAEYMRQ